ncbi:transposase [Escherichia coli]
MHPQNHLAGYSGVLQADAYGGYRALYESGRITKAACMAHARRKIHDVHATAPTDITTEALQRIGELYAIGRSPGMYSRTASGGKKSQLRH